MKEPIAFTQEQLFAGAHELRQSGIVKEETDSQAVITVAARIYRAMRQLEPEVIKPKDIFRGSL